MFRWDAVEAVTINEITQRMYRPLYVPVKTHTIVNEKQELDHLAYLHLGSELEMYKMLDTNYIALREARGDVTKLDTVIIPIV